MSENSQQIITNNFENIKQMSSTLNVCMTKKPRTLTIIFPLITILHIIMVSVSHVSQSVHRTKYYRPFRPSSVTLTISQLADLPTSLLADVLHNIPLSSTKLLSYTHTHTHTHPFKGPFSGPVRILLKQETVSGSGISWAVCKSAPRSRHITMLAPHRSVFYRPDALPAAQPTASKH